jgi:hypothetical protein
MGSKGFRLWDMGQLDSNVQSFTVGSTSAPLITISVSYAA